MSHEGKMQRGKLWHNFRDLDGNYDLGIKNDPNKMADIKYYLENINKQKKPKEKKNDSN